MSENNNIFYVYAHYKADDNEIFYIGKGFKNRAYSNQRSKWWKNIVNKHGYYIEFIKIDMSEEDSKLLEIELIAKYGRRDKGTGILINMTDGGEGSSNRIFSEETRKRMSNNRKGKFTKNPVSEETRKKLSDAAKRTRKKRSPMSEEARRNFSESLIGNQRGKGNIGRKFTEEQRKNMSDAAKKRPPASEELKQKRKEYRTGMKHSEETKAKIGLAHTGMKRSQETRDRIKKSKNKQI